LATPHRQIKQHRQIELPSIEAAPLPALYEHAQQALAECSRIDECFAWANKAEAMASYARQAKDDSLRKMADRIQARAIRRCGELLRQIEPARGTRTDLEPQEGTLPRLTRESAATDAGLSEHQRKTALRVAAIPEPEFTAAVESEAPPTVTALADRGRQSRPVPVAAAAPPVAAAPEQLVELGAIPAADYARATEAQGALRRFAEFCERHDARRIAAAFKPHEVAALRQHVSTIDGWLDRFVTSLGG
jgi:hypothetical protein